MTEAAGLSASGASGSWDWNISAGHLRIDQAFADLYGICPHDSAAAMPTKTFFQAIHPEDRPRIRIAVAAMLAGSELFSKEFRVQRQDGSVRWVHGRGQTSLDANDAPVRFSGLLIDVTERKRTEERLRIAQTAGGVGTFEYTDGFATAIVSEQFCRLLGLHPTSVLPVRTINGLVRPGDPSILPIGEIAAGGLDGEFRILRNDDQTERWIARRGEVVSDGPGAGYRLIGAIYDVTSAKRQEAELRELNETLERRIEQALEERRKIEDTLRQAQKMEAVGQLTGGIAHDFNNLLTIIIGNIDTVARRLDADADPRAKRALDNALKGAERAAALTQRLLAFSRRQPLDPKQIDVSRLLAGLTDLLTRSIAETIAIQIQPTPDLWRIEADPNQLENALLNLAVNARDAMPGGGSLTIEARNLTVEAGGPRVDLPPGAYVAIAVIDTGVGMAAETVERVFDPFFTTKEVGKGTGLGLSMVYGFVKQSGGHIRITSRMSEGTTVTLYLPRIIAAPADEIEEPAAFVGFGTASETILVVEDDEDVRAYTVGILSELGYRVIEAADGEAALRLIRKNDRPIHLLFTDVVMPNMSGPELAEAARTVQPDLKVLYMSGYTRDAIMRDGRLEPGVDLLSKPFNYQALTAKVRDLLDR